MHPARPHPPVPDIDILRHHALSSTDARHAAERVAERLRREYRVRAEWAGDRLRVSGKGIRGELALLPDAVHLTASLGLVMRPFRNQLHHAIERELDRALPHPA